MNISDKKDAVLKWLAFNPWARGNVVFAEIRNGLIKEYPALAHQADFSNELEKILERLIIEGYVQTWKSDMTYYTNLLKAPIVRNESRYTTTIEGQIAAYDLLPQKSELTGSQFEVLEEALPLIGAYGKIDWTIEVSNELHKRNIKFEESIKHFLYKNGFTKLEYIPGSGGGVYATTVFAVLTDEGRRLKELGSYKKYLEQISAEKIYEAGKEKLQMEINNKQVSLIASQIDTNEISRTTNTYIAIFTAVAGIYYIHELIKSIVPDSKKYHREQTANLIWGVVLFAAFAYYIIRSRVRQSRQKSQSSN